MNVLLFGPRAYLRSTLRKDSISVRASIPLDLVNGDERYRASARQVVHESELAIGIAGVQMNDFIGQQEC